MQNFLYVLYGVLILISVHSPLCTVFRISNDSSHIGVQSVYVPSSNLTQYSKPSSSPELDYKSFSGIVASKYINSASNLSHILCGTMPYLLKIFAIYKRPYVLLKELALRDTKFCIASDIATSMRPCSFSEWDPQ